MEVLLTIILVIVVGGWLIRVILTTVLRTWIMRKQKQFAEQFNNYQRSAAPPRPEGDVKVEKPQATETTRGVDKTVGEYVDFEEQQ